MKKDPRNTVPPLNSLAWSDATKDERRRFLDAVGALSLLEAMSETQRETFFNSLKRSLEKTEPTPPPASDSDPLELPAVLQRVRS